MALEIHQTPAASRDLKEIWGYIADDSEVAATRTLERIFAVLRTLSDKPMSGRPRTDLHAHIRSFAVGNYILFYKIDEKTLTLVRALSRFRDIGESHFEE